MLNKYSPNKTIKTFKIIKFKAYQIMKTKRLKFNIISISIMLLLICFCLCGCTEVNFVTYHNDDGSILEYVYLTVDEQTLVNNGYNIDAVKFEIQSNSYLEAKNLVEEYQNKLYNQYSNHLITNDEYTNYYNGIKIMEQKWENGEYVIGLQYTNSNVYKKYYQLLNNSQFTQNTQQVKKLFYTKTYYYGTTNYGDYTIFNRIYNYYSNTVFAQFSPQDTTLNYSYSVSSRRFHSDADTVNLDSNGNYIHTWKVNPDEPSKQIYFYTISANRSVWIIFSIVIGLGACAILCIVGVFISIKNKKSNLNNPQENTDESPDNINIKNTYNNFNNINDENIDNNTNN